MEEMASPVTQKKDIKKPLVVVLVVVLLVIGIVYFMGKKDSSQSQNKQAQPQVQTRELPQEATVSLSNRGFEPNSVTIKVGAAVRWVNNTTEDATVNSDDHPTHKKFKELNLGVFKPDATVMVIFDKPGTFTYHNHFKPEQTGTIVVQ